MSDEIRKLPTGIQNFEKLREEHFVYVDKTEYVYKVAQASVPFFLSRPRRFGKSLMLSTLRAYWEGKKELFSGLKIEKLEEDNPKAWKEYPVLYIDFNVGDNNEKQNLEDVIEAHLTEWETKYQIADPIGTLGVRFRRVIMEAHAQTGLRCVILVDEYDKPLLDLVDSPELRQHCKEVLKGFFSVLKNRDEDIQSIFITGVTKFHKVSIFSDLNQLKDISLNEDFNGICGITEDELKHYFVPEIARLAKAQGITVDECLKALKEQYDGYHFHAKGVGIYNPYSLLNSFFDKEFGDYWFESGTPSFLTRQICDNSYDVRKFSDNTIYASERSLKDYTGDSLDLIPLLYQSGYLTIKEYNSHRKRYTLAFPNKEVKYAFLDSLMPEYIPSATSTNGLDIFTLDDYVENGELENIKNVLTALFARITYTASNATFEHYFQTVIYLVFTLLGKFSLCEMHTFTGRIDCKVETERFIYLFEFKRDDSAEKALKQINDKSYTLPFVADIRKIFKIGVSFDSEKRILSDWKVEE